MKVTLEFDDNQSAYNFMIWWLDGGGESCLNYDTSSWNLNTGYLRVEGSGKIDEEV